MLDVRKMSLVITTLGGMELEISAVTGREAISELFSYQVLANYREQGAGGITAEELLGQEAELLIYRNDTLVRRVHGMISEVFDRLETESDYSTFDLHLVPRAYRLALMDQQDVLLDVDLPLLLRQKLEAATLTEGKDFEIRLSGKYPLRDLYVQYRETDLAFISRLCEHYGVAYFFEHQTGRDVMVFTDLNESYPEIIGNTQVPFRPRGEHHEIYRFEEKLRMIPAHYVVRDYNYRNPQLSLTGQSAFEDGKGILSEYGSHVKTPEEATQLARVRAEERIVSRRGFEGTTDVERILAGSRFVLSEHPMGDVRLLVTEVLIEAAQSAFGAGISNAGKNRFEANFKAIREGVRYRPARVTPKPRIHGVINAVVDADEKGKYAEVDDQGRYRVKFLFDTVTPDGKPASRYVRMAQPHSGAGYGFHFPLRAGIEVLMTFVDGDPDRPIITASVPNPQTPSPVTKANATRNVVRTGGGNEINFDDTTDGQRIKMHSPFASTTLQLGEKNAPEQGAALQTWGAISQFALAGTAKMSSWDNMINMASGTITSGNVISSAGNTLADTSISILTLLDLATNTEGGLASIAVKVVEKLKEKQAKELENAKKNQENAEQALSQALALRAAQMFQSANNPAAVERMRQELGIDADKPLTPETIQAALQAKIDAQVEPIQTKSDLEGTTMRGEPAMSFGQAIEALSADPNDEKAKAAITGLMKHMAEMQKQLADPEASEATKTAARAEIEQLGGLALVFQQQGGSSDPVVLPTTSAWTNEVTAYQEATKSITDLTAQVEAHQEQALQDPDSIDPTSDASLLVLALAVVAAKAEYQRVEYETTEGDRAQSLAQAEEVLSGIQNIRDGVTAFVTLYSTINGLLGMLNESETVTDVKKQWDRASDLLIGSKHRQHDGKFMLGKSTPNWMESLTGWPIIFASLLAGTVMPGAAVLVQVVLAKKRAAYKAAVEAASTAGKVITANSPEPTFNIIDSEGTSVVKGKEAAMVAGQVTVLLAEVEKPPPASPPSTFFGGIAEKFTELRGKVTALFKPGANLMTQVSAMLAQAVPNNAGTIAVIGETQTIVASPKLVEVAGTEAVKVTSTQHVDVLGEQKVDVLAGPRAKPPWGLKVDSTAKKVTLGHVTGDHRAEITHASTKIGNLTANEGMQTAAMMTKVEHGGNSALELKKESATLRSSMSVNVRATNIKISGTRIMIG